MRRTLTSLTIIVWLLLSGTVHAAVALPPNAHIVEYDAPSVGLRLKYTVLLPEGYADSTLRYPVLYLLHGHTGHFTSWLTYAGLPAETADRLHAIVVLADGGNAFYTNWHGSTETRPQRWEDAVADDLVSEVDRRWRTRPVREARAIGGLSMGGYGAVAMALRHPERFGFAFSSAGALGFPSRVRDELVKGAEDWNRPESWSNDDKPPVPIPGFATQQERTPRGRVFVSIAQVDAADPMRLVDRIDPAQAPFIHLDCGLQDTLLPETLLLAERLRRRRLPHALVLLPGEHDSPYWQEAFARAQLAVARFFNSADASPTTKFAP